MADFRPTAVGEARNVKVARRQFQQRRWEVIALGLPALDHGLEPIGEIKQDLPSTKIMLLGLGRDAQAVTRAIKAGASGYLRKDASLPEVIRAFRCILAGHHYVGERFALPPASLPHTRLSKREFLVFTGIAEGKRLSAIAQELNLDTRTVSTYRRRILQKMSMQTDAELILYATNHELHIDLHRLPEEA